MNLIRWIIAAPIVIGAVLFALANPTNVMLTWSPIHEPKELPLYFIALSFLGIGFLLGAVIAWLNMGKTRADKRRLKKENKQLEKDINESNEKLTQAMANDKPEDKGTSDTPLIEVKND